MHFVSRVKSSNAAETRPLINQGHEIKDEDETVYRAHLIE